MPTYNYRCKECHFEFEELQRMTEASLTLCPACEKETLTRMIGSGAGVMFKGSGYYLTDYKKTGNNSSSATKATTEKTASAEKTNLNAKESTQTMATPAATTSQEKNS